MTTSLPNGREALSLNKIVVRSSVIEGFISDTYVLDEVSFWEDFLFLTFNILLC